MRPGLTVSTFIASVVVAATATAAPQYQIFDLGVVQVGDTASQGFGISPGGVVVGRSFRSGGAQAFTWIQGGGLVGLPNLAGRSFAVANSALDTGAGTVVGTAATTAFGSGRLPVIWHGGVVSQLPLPAGETLGDANDVNVSNVAVGSVDGGSTQQAVIYNGGSATVITQTTSNGSFFVTAFGINDSGRIVGFGIDPNNAARNVGIVYDMGNPAAFEVGALPDANGALAFGVSNNGHVVGSSMMNQGSGLPFIYSDAVGMVAIPLATGTSQGSARGVNSAGLVVGQDSSAFSIPFLWDGTTTYRLADLLPPGSGWDLSMNTSSSALGINDDGVIVGTGVHNGETRAYAMVPVTSTPTPPPSPTATPTPPPPTPTPGQCFYTYLHEDFDTVTAPALPPGWSSSFTTGPANCIPAGTCPFGTNWTTSTTNFTTPPNNAFHDAPGCVTDSSLYSPAFFIFSAFAGVNLYFDQNYNLENGLDGAVLEVSINGGPFTDFVAAGGTFFGGGYNGTISAATLSPIAGRAAWTGNSGGNSPVNAIMPPVANNSSVILRFRLATDCSGASAGWSVDRVDVTYLVPCPSPTPSPTGTPTPTPTPSPTPPSPTPTPPTTPTPVPCTIISLNENFDAVTAPALPAGWSSSFNQGPAGCPPAQICTQGTNWATTTTTPASPPNCAFHDAPSCVTDSALSAPSFVSFMGQMLEFQHYYDMSSGFDGAVLEISINGGPFTDFLAAGGTFFPGGGYNGTISSGFQNPLGGRAAWTGDSGGYITTFATMPPAASQQSVVLRFRLATDCGGSTGNGWRLDNIKVVYSIPCVTPSPTLSPPATPTPSATPSSTPAAQPLNLSTRLRVQTGDNVGIAGFIIGGTAPKNLLFRGIGPSLAAFGVADALANPTLDLRRPDGTRIRANDNWRDDPAQAAAIEATGIPPTNDMEAAIIETLNPGSYTVILRGMGMTTGVGLVEIYDLNQGVNSKLANLSTRALVSTGDSIVIAGFVLGGNTGDDRAVVRGIGPSLTALGISNALANPTLELRDSNGALLMANNNWQDDPLQAAELTAAGLAPPNPSESGIAITLPPGAYTALLAGVNNGTGVGVVEVYDRGAPP
jgi:hypothetical protein